MASNAYNELIEALNKSVEMQIDAKLQTASFDSTVEGVIVAEIDVENGVYLVQILNAKFEAYAATGRYYEGETVHIKVPQGDYTKLKFITGRKTSNDEGVITAFRFKYPFDDFIALSNLTSDSGTSLNKLTTLRGWRANKPSDGAEPNYALSNIETDPNILWHWRRDGKELLGTTLGVQMDVKTYLGGYNPIKGDYGIRFIVRGDEIQEDGQVLTNVAKEFYFNTDLMYGNPYGFLDESTQQCLLDVSKFNKIEEIAAYFYQDHQFLDDTGNAIPYVDAYDSSVECEPNIYLNNLSIGFGLLTKDIGNEDLRLYTYDSTSFGEDSTSTTPRALLDTRTLRFGWVHKCPDDNYMMINSVATLARFNEEFIETEKKKAHIYWFRQVRSNEEVEGIPYVAPGTSVMDMETKRAELETRRDTLVNSTNRDFFSSQEAYDNYINNIKTKYATQIAAIDDMIASSGDQTLQRISTMGGIDYRYIPDWTDSFSMTYQMDIHQFRERFKVVVAWENTYEVSEPLEFRNVDTTVLEVLADRRNEIVFRMLRTQTYKENNTTKTRLIEENSLGNFFVYDENNQCILNEEETFWSDMWFYIQLWIWDEEQETYVPLTTTSTADPVTVEWQFPTDNTMLKLVRQLDANDIQAFNNSLLPITNNFDGVQASTRKFLIDDYWDMRKHNNIVRAIVNRNGKQYNVSKLMLFGQSGTMGSKYTLRIDLTHPLTGYAIVGGQGFTISTSVYSQEGEKLESSAFLFTYELLNPTACVLGYDSQYPGPVTIAGSGYTNSGYKAILERNAQGNYLPPLFRVTVDLKDPEYKYDISNVKGFMSVTSAAGPAKYDVGCPDRIEYKSDGTMPVYDNGVFTVRDVASLQLVYPTWQLEQWNGTSRMTSGYKYLSLETSHVYYNSLNTNYLSGTPTGSGVTTYTVYKLNPYLDGSVVRPKASFFWADDMESNYPSFIGFTYDRYTFWLSIAFAHNVYASSIVNNWDGQLTIDKEKNAILTRMLSAGVKDTKNRFSGILMGDWSDYGDKSIDPIGLYGFKNGELTFGFKTDGSGFIGKAGYGLIIFDGELALISDWNKEHYINLNPVRFTVENGKIVVDKNRESYSQYFLYAKNKKLDTTNADNTEVGSDTSGTSTDYLSGSSKDADYGFLNVKWAKTFMNDTTSDYFVVDPNNGVYLSGGLIAKYGYIGDCLELSSAGLTYEKNNGIIFIGLERTRDGKIVTESHPTSGYDDIYWSSQKGDKYNFRNGTKPSTSWGRYVVWIGDTNNKGRPKYLYPNFGIEHNGIVHLNKAYVQGEIHASSLFIGMDDGNYHDARARFARTYYSKINPANLTTSGGICEAYYGDILVEGDLWYDTNMTVNIKDISTFSLQQTDNTSLDTSTPATDSTFDFTINDLSEKACRGYMCYKWRGKAYKDTDCVDEDGTTIIANHKGWERLPVLSKDTLTEMSTLALESTTAITTLQLKLTSTVRSAYDSIRKGMSPVSFFQDGDCYISISKNKTTVTGIGDVPAGIAIYQVNSSGTYTGSSFLLNGKRMGFYKKAIVDGAQVDMPLLTYYEGNMGLAGSLAFGLDFTKALTQTDTANKDISMYSNYLDGPNAAICLGNGAIKLESNINKTNGKPTVTIGGKDDGATALIYLAGYELRGQTTLSFSASYGLKVDQTNDKVEATKSYDTVTVQTGDSTGSISTKTNTIKYTTYTIGSKSSHSILNLNSFKIVNDGRGIQILENTTTIDNSGSYEVTILKPTNANATPDIAGTKKNLLINWDLVHGHTANFTNVDATTVFCKNLYVYKNNGTAEAIATQKWVADKINDAVDLLAGLIKDALSTGNKAYGAAKNHSHNASGRVASASWAG